MKKAKIADIFFSQQGEGVYAGIPQVFIRFYGCMCHCRFCDTPLNHYEKYSPLEAYYEIKRFTQGFHSLCITGGEPLLNADFLWEFLKLVKYDGIKTYLETNGILADQLERLIDDIDIIAMDFKLPSSTGMRQYWNEHRQFLERARQKEVFVKMVICLDTTLEDIDQAIAILREAKANDIPVVLQPNFFELGKELLAYLRQLKSHCRKHLKQVEVIPQLHKITGVK